MAKIFIKCPSCHRELSFDEIPGWQNMIVECPACHFKANASVYQSGNASQGGQGCDDDPTIIGNGKDTYPTNQDCGCLRIEGTMKVFNLHKGINIIGRIADTGTADIRIAKDPYMSRRHVRIDVVDGAHGLEYHLVEINSKNIVQFNGKPIQRGDVLLLKFGDKLHLGHTDVIFEGTDQESTVYEE